VKILLIGPIPTPVTGVAIANQTLFDNYAKYTDNKIIKINTNYDINKENIGKFNILKVINSIKVYKELYKIKKVDKVYMTIGQTFFGVLKYFPYFLTAKLLKKEIIIHIHGNHLWKEYKELIGYKKKIFFRILSMTNKGIVSSESLKKNLTPFLKDNQIHTVNNFVEDFLFSSVVTNEFDTLKIIYMSHLTKEKGILDLLESLILLDRKGINFKAKIAGGIDVSIQDDIEKLLSKLAERVEYVGELGKNRKEFLTWGNIFVLPTYYAMEGQPISIFEAMALGNMLLLTKHAGIPDIFKEDVNGFYVDKYSPKSISEKLININENISIIEKIVNNNRIEAKEKYKVKTYVTNLDNIFEDN
jgi:glycosyltransferase involved in cell wall biosynthesis